MLRMISESLLHWLHHWKQRTHCPQQQFRRSAAHHFAMMIARDKAYSPQWSGPPTPPIGDVVQSL
jgi:hypothetical protein